jgi:hypothetical protein
MKIIKIENVPQVSYQIRHWLKWYWVTDMGQVYRISKIFKNAKDIFDE